MTSLRRALHFLRLGGSRVGWGVAIAPVGLVGLVASGLGGVWPHGDSTDAWAIATEPHAQIALDDWLPEHAELLDPRARLPQMHTLPIARLRAVLAGTHDGGDNPALRKLAVWVAHSHGTPLPDGFFDRPPAMHPSGQSYAALADAPGRRHVSEAPPEGPLGTTTAATRRALVDGYTRIVGENWVLLPAQPHTLHATPRAVFDARLADRGLRYATCTTPSPRCLIPTPRPWVPGLAALASLVIVAGLVLQTMHARAQRRRVDRDRAFVLRTLTHELRTPASAIGLELDRLRSAFDHLPSDGQDAFLGLAAANQRLRRTLGATADYLAVEQGRVPLEPATVSLSALFADTDIDIHGAATVTTDRRWLTIAVHNLLANAHTHGTAPVHICIEPTPDGARLHVCDAGTLDVRLDDLCRPFDRGPTSTGLGLGLALTRRIGDLLGDGLSLHPAPTRFSLHLRNLKIRDPT